ncbi:protein transport protein Sec61 subunit beta-like isoform X3 [Tubulanus polymorphus]|uniref:protein transport protein Sec61 subunit beta-like isoform X1 n=1 Tax=Tubulanus polymorphus TaxID=672921 RepID=UPI003DA2F791
MPTPASSTSVGAGGRSPSSKSVSPRSGGGTVRQRKTASSSSGATRRPAGGGGGGGAGMWRFYTEDSPGIKVGPVPVLVMSLLFIASVFMLHIWGKYTRS